MAKRKLTKGSGLQGFVPAREYIEDRASNVFVSAYAQEKAGKTRFGCTAPGRIAYFDIDGSTHGSMDLMEDRLDDIEVIEIRYKPGDQDSCMEAWEDFLETWEDAWDSEYFDSVVLDTQDELLEMERYGFFGDNSKLQLEYRQPNAEFLRALKRFKTGDKHLIVLSKAKPNYKGKGFAAKPDGTYRPAGFKDLPYLAQVTVELYREDQRDGLVYGLEVKQLRAIGGVTLQDLQEDDGHIIEGLDDAISFDALMEIIGVGE